MKNKQTEKSPFRSVKPRSHALIWEVDLWVLGLSVDRHGEDACTDTWRDAIKWSVPLLSVWWRYCEERTMEVTLMTYMWCCRWRPYATLLVHKVWVLAHYCIVGSVYSPKDTLTRGRNRTRNLSIRDWPAIHCTTADLLLKQSLSVLTAYNSTNLFQTSQSDKVPLITTYAS